MTIVASVSMPISSAPRASVMSTILPPRAATSCMFETVFSSQMIVRRDHDDRQVLVDQRDRPVLQLAGRIALGVDVGDLLELQRAFESEGIGRAAAEIEHVGRPREIAVERLDPGLDA